MSVLIACILLAVTGQGWDKPVIQEAELAAPVEIEAATPPAATLPKPPEEGGGGNRTQTGAPPESAPADGAVRELHWEYNEDGQPVVRDSTDLSETEAPPSARVEAPQSMIEPKAQESQETKERPQRSRSVATFWFVLPKQ